MRQNYTSCVKNSNLMGASNSHNFSSQSFKLLLNSTYELNNCGTKLIQIGICPTKNFTPILKIFSNTGNSAIYLTEKDWNSILNYSQNIRTYFYDVEKPEEISIGTLKIKFMLIEYGDTQVKTVQIYSNSGCVNMGVRTVENFLNLKQVLTASLSLLKENDLFEYFREVSIKVNANNGLQTLNYITDNEENYILKKFLIEMKHFFPVMFF